LNFSESTNSNIAPCWCTLLTSFTKDHKGKQLSMTEM
jgi:hypothetical protein